MTGRVWPGPMTDESDEALYRRLKRGDMSAFDVLFDRYESRLFGFLVSRVGNRADAEDLFHEAFLATLKSGEATFDHEGAFRTWLYRIARNLTLNRRRSLQRGERALARLPEELHEPGADELLGDRQKSAALQDALERLPPTLAELFQLRTSGLSYEEMAAVLEIPLGTIKSRMNQMVTQLKEELRPWTAR